MRTRLPLLALVLVATASCALPWPGAPAPAGVPLPRDPQLLEDTLPNGLRYFIRVNREPRQRAELRLVVNAGSILEDEDQLGLAHVVEHMAFNGTRNFQKQELIDYLESVGMRFGPDVNAYTSFDETVYMLTLPTDSAGVLETGFQILEDWAWGVEFDSLEVEKERGVVVEEWRLGRGAGERLRNKQFPVLAGNSRYAQRLPIGTRESLMNFDHASLRRFYETWYRPDLMAVVAVGDFDPERVEALIREHFSRIPRPERPPRRREYRIPGNDETLVSVARDPELTGASVSMYLKRVPEVWTTDAAYRKWVVESLASSMLTNRLSEYTQRPRSPFLDVSSFQGRFFRPLSAFVLSVRVPDAAVTQGLETLLIETERASRHGFTASELEREKRELLRLMEQRFAEREKTTSGSFAADYVSHFLYGGALTDLATEWEMYLRFIPSIRLEEVNAQARSWMRAENRVVLLSAPDRPELSVPSESEVRRTIARMRGRNIPPYADDVSSEPLLAEVPPPAEIVAERRFDAVGVLEWTLENGVRVVLKPTDFRAEEVLLAGRSPGGTSLVADSDYVAAITAPAVVQAGGLGHLSAIELRKRLAGMVAGVGTDIGEMHEGISGAASPRDLETLFQLVYLKFTAPRVDSAAFLAYQTQARAMVASRTASPEVVFSDTLRALMSQNHPRARPPTVEMFDQLDLHRSFEIYRDRFGDASDFTFYLVGSFDPDSIRPLVQRYLGSLPSRGRVEAGRDLGIRPPAGVVRRTVHKGMEEKALTQLVFNGPMEFSRENIYALRALADVLRIRLREQLREELSGTYGVDVQAGGISEPVSRYQVAVGFGAGPERLDELVAEVFAQIDSLRVHGPTADEMETVKEMQTRARELDLRQNHFWLNQLMSYERYGWDWSEIAGLEARIDALNTTLVHDAARRYLDPANYVQVSLFPETRAPLSGGAVGTRAEPRAGDGVSQFLANRMNSWELNAGPTPGPVHVQEEAQ